MLYLSAAEEAAIPDIPTASESIDRFGKLAESVWNRFSAAAPTILLAIVILAVGLILSKLTVKLMGKAMERSRLDLTVTRFIRSAVKIVLYVLVITIVLTVLGVPTTSIIAVIGTAGVAVGLALQNSLSNLAGGFLILFTKSFRVGDYIRCDGEEGTVESISILYTKLHTPDNKAVFIPNGAAANGVVVNYSERPTRRVDMTFSISYSADYDRAVSAIKAAIADIPQVLNGEGQEPFVRMCEHGSSAVIIAARVWTNTADYWSVHFDMLEKVRRKFIEENIEIPFDQLDVHITKDAK